MASDPEEERAAADRPETNGPVAEDAGSRLVDRWLALDRGWQALGLGLGIVAAHAAVQFVAAPF